jgi:hypothetical protein
MRVLRLCSIPLVLIGVGSFAANVSASMLVRQMNLQQMCGAARRIFRGTVVGASEGMVSVGGGHLSTVIYRIRVDESFKGTFDLIKGQRIATVQMLRPSKRPASGPLRQLSLMDDLPVFQEGHDYLILATAPSAAGLSTTIGLTQGVFKLTGKPGQETAVNGNDNVGLNPNAPRGPIPYSSLRSTIRQVLGR